MQLVFVGDGVSIIPLHPVQGRNQMFSRGGGGGGRVFFLGTANTRDSPAAAYILILITVFRTGGHF